MNRMFGMFAIIALLLAGTVATYADLASPVAKPAQQPPPAKLLMSSGLAIVPDKKAYQARLEISQETLNELRASLASLPANQSDSSLNEQSIAKSISGSSARTILAGMFLFLSLSFAGVWLARGTHARGQKLVSAVLIGVAVIGAAAIITRGNIGPPPNDQWRRLTKNLNEGKITEGGLDIEVVAEGKGIRLIMPMSTNSGSTRRSDEE